MTIDWTISVGHLLTAGLYTVTLIGIYLGILRRLDRLEAKVDTIWAWFVDQKG